MNKATFLVMEWAREAIFCKMGVAQNIPQMTVHLPTNG